MADVVKLVPAEKADNRKANGLWRSIVVILVSDKGVSWAPLVSS